MNKIHSTINPYVLIIVTYKLVSQSLKPYKLGGKFEEYLVRDDAWKLWWIELPPCQSPWKPMLNPFHHYWSFSKSRALRALGEGSFKFDFAPDMFRNGQFWGRITFSPLPYLEVSIIACWGQSLLISDEEAEWMTQSSSLPLRNMCEVLKWIAHASSPLFHH